jgi:hypothetical protein
MADDFKPVDPFDVSDVGLLPRRFDLLALEVREVAELARTRIVPALVAVADRLDEIESCINKQERDLLEMHRRLDELTKKPPRAA